MFQYYCEGLILPIYLSPFSFSLSPSLILSPFPSRSSYMKSSKRIPGCCKLSTPVGFAAKPKPTLLLMHLSLFKSSDCKSKSKILLTSFLLIFSSSFVTVHVIENPSNWNFCEIFGTLDLGTLKGLILMNLLVNFANRQVTAMDCSPADLWIIICS